MFFKSTASFCLMILVVSVAFGQQPAATFEVKYISGENIYIDAGIADSLMVGDRLEVRRGDSVVAELEIVFAAENSASCKLLTLEARVAAGDRVYIGSKIERPQTPAPVIAEEKTVSTQQQPDSLPIKPRAQKARISGGIAVQLHKWDDRSASNLDFSQPSFRINFKANRLWGKDLSLNLRVTTRYNQRSREYSPDVPKTEWRNRIYQLSFGYANDLAPFSLEVGRVISNKMSGVGYIDGMIIQKGIDNFHVGAFAGTQPEWQYSDFQTSLQKYGGYINYTGGDFQSNRLESTVAAAGEYHGSTVSRELLYIRNNITLGGRWNIYQSAEIDFNRSWKKEKLGESINLTNLYVSGRGKFADWLSAGLSFDNRRNYWTYETRTLADSLFDDVLRKGFRADISLRPLRNYFLFGNFGFHKRGVDEGSTYSYSFGLNKTNLFSVRQSINAQFAGFTGPFTDGYNYSIRFNRTIRRGDMISFGYGAYIYKFGNNGNNRTNDWIQVSGQFDIYRRLYSSATYEYNMGDDTKGNRVIAELGYRF